MREQQEAMLEAENEAAHRAMMMVLVVLMTMGCGMGSLLATVVAWLMRKQICLGFNWPSGW